MQFDRNNLLPKLDISKKTSGKGKSTSKEFTQDMVILVVEHVKGKYGRMNLAKFKRELSISRQTARTLEKHDFRIVQHGNYGKEGSCKPSPYQQLIYKEYLMQGTINSKGTFFTMAKLGYNGELIIKDYVRDHRDLVSAKRVLAIGTHKRRSRYETDPCEMFQMD